VSDEAPLQVPVPADIDAADRIVYGLTARQVAILAGTGGWLWLAFRALCPPVPPVALVVAAMPVLAVAAVLALGRRDGISLDRWVFAALLAARAPRRFVPMGDGRPAVPRWAPEPCGVGPVQVAPLRLPAAAIDESGVVDVDDGRVALTAVSTVTFDLRTGGEQQALVDGFGQWLNALSGPTQIVVSTRPADVEALAEAVDRRSPYLPSPALAEAADGYVAFLRWLADDRDPLERRVTVAHRVGAHTEAKAARRQADQTARTVTGLGAAAVVLDGGLVGDVLAAACDPWQTPTFGRSRPGSVVTADAGTAP
jgi:hypothetical protein